MLGKAPAPKSPLLLRSHPRSTNPLLRPHPISRPPPRGHFAQVSGSAAALTPGPTLWVKECTTPPGCTSNATVVGSDTDPAGLSATAARSRAGQKFVAPPPFLLLLGAAILRLGLWGKGGGRGAARDTWSVRPRPRQVQRGHVTSRARPSRLAILEVQRLLGMGSFWFSRPSLAM